MRILRYSHELKISTFVSFIVVPPNEVTDAGGAKWFDAVVEEVKRLGFKYTITERTDTFIEGGE